MAILQDSLLFLFLASAVYTDWRFGKIFNKLVVPGLVAAVALHAIDNGVSGATFALQGAGVGLGLLLIPFLLRGMAAGDAKLMGMAGAFVGPALALKGFMCAGLVGAGLALVLLAMRRQVQLAMYTLAFPRSFSPALSFQAEGGSWRNRRFPYAIAIAAGMAIAVIAWS